MASWGGIPTKQLERPCEGLVLLRVCSNIVLVKLLPSFSHGRLVLVGTEGCPERIGVNLKKPNGMDNCCSAPSRLKLIQIAGHEVGTPATALNA